MTGKMSSIHTSWTFTIGLEPIQSYKRFLIAGNEEVSISSANGCSRQQLTSPIDSLTSISYMLADQNFHLTVQKLFSLIDLHIFSQKWKILVDLGKLP